MIVIVFVISAFDIAGENFDLSLTLRSEHMHTWDLDTSLLVLGDSSLLPGSAGSALKNLSHIYLPSLEEQSVFLAEYRVL